MKHPISSASRAAHRAIHWRAFLPARTRIDGRERLRLGIGTLTGIFLTAMLSHLGGSYAHAVQPWLVAPLGASAILVFALPASPMAQPWAVVGGNTLSALMGIAAVHAGQALGHPEAVVALAVALAVALMLSLRCLHPPGGAMALMMVLGGIDSPSFALYPVLVNSVLMVAAGVLYNNLTGRAYPHMQLPDATSGPAGQGNGDIDAVLRDYNQVLDISRDDLDALLQDLRKRAHARKLNDVRCADIMSTDLATVEYGTSLQDGWALLRSRHIKALPVIDRAGRIAGIVTLADFMRAADLDLHHGFGAKLKQLIRSTTAE
ncbi:MAG: CBS domain-containing protein, partial [Haliea sp.]